MRKLSDTYNDTSCKPCKKEPTVEYILGIIECANMYADITKEDNTIKVKPTNDTYILKLGNLLNNKLPNRISLSSDTITIFL